MCECLIYSFMPYFQDCFRDDYLINLEGNCDIKGVDEFRSRLEKDFFCRATVRNCCPTREKANLIIELDCPFELDEVLHHLQQGYWDKSEPVRKGETPLNQALEMLHAKNRISFDVEEFSIFLKDVSIVIKKIFTNSIQDQLCLVMQSIAAHYAFLTKDLRETPYEIHIPVFEESMVVKNISSSRRDYLKFWGLYYGSEEDAMVYDLNKRSLIKGELLMLNR